MSKASTENGQNLTKDMCDLCWGRGWDETEDDICIYCKGSGKMEDQEVAGKKTSEDKSDTDESSEGEK